VSKESTPEYDIPGEDARTANKEWLIHVIKPNFTEKLFHALSRSHQDTILELTGAFFAAYGKATDAFPENPDLAYLLTMADQSIRRVIKFSKQLKCFAELPRSDQVALLKNGAMGVMLMRSSNSYDGKKGKWVLHHQSGSKSLQVSPQCCEDTSVESKNFWSKYTKMASGVSRVTRGDDTVLTLILAVALFQIPAVDLVNKEAVLRANELYRTVLKEYWQARYNEDGDKAMKGIDEVMKTLKNEIREAHSLMLSSKADILKPLVQEIFDVSD
jgi:hypothetical protein